jgi:hypothetical protein
MPFTQGGHANYSLIVKLDLLYNVNT